MRHNHYLHIALLIHLPLVEELHAQLIYLLPNLNSHMLPTLAIVTELCLPVFRKRIGIKLQVFEFSLQDIDGTSIVAGINTSFFQAV